MTKMQRVEQTISGNDLNKILPDLLKFRMRRQKNMGTIFTIYISKQFKGTAW